MPEFGGDCSSRARVLSFPLGPWTWTIWIGISKQAVCWFLKWMQKNGLGTLWSRPPQMTNVCLPSTLGQSHNQLKADFSSWTHLIQRLEPIAAQPKRGVFCWWSNNQPTNRCAKDGCKTRPTVFETKTSFFPDIGNDSIFSGLGGRGEGDSVPSPSHVLSRVHWPHDPWILLSMVTMVTMVTTVTMVRICRVTPLVVFSEATFKVNQNQICWCQS